MNDLEGLIRQQHQYGVLYIASSITWHLISFSAITTFKGFCMGGAKGKCALFAV